MKNKFSTKLLTYFLLLVLIGSLGCEDDCIEPNLSPVVEDQTFSIDENAISGTSVGTVIASDPDLTDLTYTLLNQTPINGFDLDQLTGELTVSGSAILSFEEYEIFTLIIQVSDGEIDVTATILININDLLENFEITLQPNGEKGKDAILYDLQPNNNYGTHPQINAHAWTNGGIPQTMRGLIQFDFSDIPESALIEQANLSLYHFVASNNSGHSQLSGSNESVLQKVIESWNEETVTWNNQPAITSIDEVTLSASVSEDQNYMDIDVTNLVINTNQQLLDNFGFMLSLKTESYFRSLVFASSDVETEEIHPKLVIQFLD